MVRISRPASVLTVAALLLGGLTACAGDPQEYELPGGAGDTDLVIGATFHGFWNYDSTEEMSAALRALRDAGGTWVRIDVGWRTIEPERDIFSSWALRGYSDAVDAARREGFKVLLVLQGVPSWANGADDETLAPEDVADFGDFALELTRRFAGRVDAVELWNEPNNPHFFRARTPGQEAQEHAAMVADAHAKIKESGPQGEDAVLVLAGGTSYVDVSWWEQMYDAGVAGHTDVVAVNPYPVPSDTSPLAEDDGTRYRMRHLSELVALMEAEGDTGTPIWFTELGWSEHRNWFGADRWSRGVTQDLQADYLEQTVWLVETAYPQVEQVFWYNLRDRDDVRSRHVRGFGLLERDLTPKPVLDRMRELTAGG